MVALLGVVEVCGQEDGSSIVDADGGQHGVLAYALQPLHSELRVALLWQPWVGTGPAKGNAPL